MSEREKQFPQEYAVWWVDQEATILIDYMRPSLQSIPKYIVDQFNNQRGRVGRGRLWVAEGLGLPTLLNKDGLLVIPEWLQHAGIVIKAQDVWHLIGMPGFITDMGFQILGKRP